jgi:hypothetical protein
MDPGLETRVIKFIADFVGVDESKIGLQTTIGDGLGVDGDDAIEFLHSYAKTFEVDLSEFRFLDHFLEEGVTFSELLQFPWQLIRIWRGEDTNVILNKIPLHVQDLIEAAEKKRWTPKVVTDTR